MREHLIDNLNSILERILSDSSSMCLRRIYRIILGESLHRKPSAFWKWHHDSSWCALNPQEVATTHDDSVHDVDGREASIIFIGRQIRLLDAHDGREFILREPSRFSNALEEPAVHEFQSNISNTIFFALKLVGRPLKEGLKRTSPVRA